MESSSKTDTYKLEMDRKNYCKLTKCNFLNVLSIEINPIATHSPFDLQSMAHKNFTTTINFLHVPEKKLLTYLPIS